MGPRPIDTSRRPDRDFVRLPPRRTALNPGRPAETGRTGEARGPADADTRAPWQRVPAWTEAGPAEVDARDGTHERPPMSGRMGAPGADRPIGDGSPRPADQPPPPQPTVGIGGTRIARAGDTPREDPPTRTLPDIRYDSTDAGDYYCEHAFYCAQEAARAQGSQVATNADGDRLVGFIHFPEDAQTSQPRPANPTDAELAARHGDARRVVGAAIAGYYDQAARQVEEGPIRILLTGYGRFGNSIQNNPTGDFVSHRANIDAAMEEAFGANLVGRPPANADMNQPLTYTVRQPDGSTRDVQIRAIEMPVDDRALDPNHAGSLPHTMGAFSPHAVVSMGVRPGSSHFDVEGRADDGGMRHQDGRWQHERGRARTDSGYRNRSLERAVEWARVHPSP